MKRFTITVALAVMMTMPMFAEHVDPETARKVATTFLNNNGAKATQLTDLSKTVGFPNLYIFTADEGFVVMAADDCVQPILGYSFENTFVADDMPENVRGWLQGYDDDIQHAIESKMRATAKIAQQWNDLLSGNAKAGKATAVVAPLIQTKWDQTGYYNLYCPAVSDGPSGRAFTGCVATAMAQVMKYWAYPTQGIGSHSYTWGSQTLSADFSSTTYDWENMKNYYQYYYDDESAYHTVSAPSSTETKAVSLLMYHCGVSLDMNYGGESTNGSSASTAKVAESLKTYFNYSPRIEYRIKNDYDNDVWENMVKGELDDGRPLQYRGRSSGGGHSFVCDGYNNDGKFHFNWGWAGHYNGYFSLDNLDTGANNQSGQGNGIYTNDQGALFGIEPISSLAAPTLSASVSEGYIHLTWNAIDDAVSYDLYKNDVKIETGITGTNYLDSNVTFGSYYTYYVRAVSNENKSNPSNTVTKLYSYRSLIPTNLSATYTSNNSILTWTGYEGNLSFELHYATVSDNSGWCADTDLPDTYWGQRYPAASITNFDGMKISKISCCFYYASNYTLYAFNGEVAGTDKLCERTYSKANAGMEWIDFNFDTPLQIDCSKDLWIVLYNNDSNASHPALSGYYSGDNDTEGKYLATTLDDLPNTICANDISWLIKATLTDGTYTYHLFDNGVSIEDDITATSYTVINPANNMVHQYTVKTNYYNGESTASNKASLALGTASLETLILGDNDKMTITEGSKLTVSGTLNNNNSANLIIENDAQLITSNDVAATMEKKIVGFGNNNNAQTGWYTIATPFTTNVTPAGNMLENTYDLYLYDEENVKWRNYKQEESEYYHFNIEPNTGYLYANSENTTLSFADTVRASNASITIPLSYASTNENKKGFNLLGNPFSCELTDNSNITMGGTSFSTYYIADGTIREGKNLIACNISNRPIKPGEGFIVQATGENQSLVFNGRSQGEQKGYISIEAGNENFTDRAFVQIGGGNTLRKITLSDNTAQVYVMQDNMDFAAVMIEETQGEIPVNFCAAEDGSFTLTINPEGVEMNYLHLIDNMTGSDVDLLTNPSYTFKAKTTDYESRFKLVFASGTVFADGASTGSASFAFFNNGQWIINNNGESTVQVLDVTGHILRSECVNGVCDIQINYAPGVYVLRLINGEKVRTQKIVIE